MAGGILPHQKTKYWSLRQEGYSQANASLLAGFSASTARRLEAATPQEIKNDIEHAQRTEKLPGPIKTGDLGPEAQRALWDFPYFQRRYFGRINAPWQEEAANRIVDLLETEDEEYAVVNAPPGSGKTVCFCHDIPAWITVRDRTIRGLIGSATMSLAKRNVLRLRRTFERTFPERGIPRDVARGDALDALSTLAADFGRFKPTTNDPWTADSFLVMQHDEMGAVSEKEPTWSAYGIDTAFIGGRYPFIIWDDLVDPKKTRTVEKKDDLEEIWDAVCETRLEPGGLLILQGQRISSDDLYRYNLDKVRPIDDDEEDEEANAVEDMGKKYHHIVFKAHYEDKCEDKHARTSEPYPKGCLLVPRRIRWQKIRELQENKGQNFAVLYQQEDTDPTEVLVDKAWIWGDDPFIGCIDRDRDRLEIPDILFEPGCVSIATADPSPTMFWAVTWWIFHPESQQRFLIDLLRKKMDAPDFLDWSTADKCHTGVMQDWQRASEILGVPITAWIIEINAAQRFLMQYDHVRIWRGLHDVDIIPHTTGRNKADPEFGVQTIAPHYRYGRVRLPGKGEGRMRSMHLIDEVTRYPHYRYDDCVMANWFFEANLPNLYRPARPAVRQWRPTWVRQKVSA